MPRIMLAPPGGKACISPLQACKIIICKPKNVMGVLTPVEVSLTCQRLKCRGKQNVCMRDRDTKRHRETCRWMSQGVWIWNQVHGCGDLIAPWSHSTQIPSPSSPQDSQEASLIALLITSWLCTKWDWTELFIQLIKMTPSPLGYKGRPYKHRPSGGQLLG